MAIAMKHNNSRKVSLWDRLFSKPVRETRCSECGRPYLEHPDREPMHRVSRGNAEAMIYENVTATGCKIVFRFGAWHTLNSSQHGFTFCQLYETHDLKALLHVVAEAIEFSKVHEKVQKKGIVEKMSSRRSLTTKPTEEYGKRKKANP